MELGSEQGRGWERRGRAARRIDVEDRHRAGVARPVGAGHSGACSCLAGPPAR